MIGKLSIIAAAALLPAIASAGDYESRTIDIGGGRTVTATYVNRTATPVEQSPYALQGREQQAPRNETPQPTSYWAGTHFITVVAQ